MRREPDKGRHLRAMALVASLAFLAAGCSSGSGATKTTPPPAARNTVPSSSAVLPTSSAPTSAAPVADSGLSGSWSGQYSGAFTGTFKLTWQQAGSSLSGSITLSTTGAGIQTESLNGTVNGSTINFGTVGSEAITYSGKVSGDSMSGTYQIAGQPGGPWSASKS